MNFGVRLPGPFRVGISSSGRMNVGVTAGPFSVSTGVGQGRRPAVERQEVYPIDLDGAVVELLKDGWTLTGHDGRTAFFTRGWKAGRVDAVDGGVTIAPIPSRRALIVKTVIWLAVVFGLLALCGNVIG